MEKAKSFLLKGKTAEETAVCFSQAGAAEIISLSVVNTHQNNVGAGRENPAPTFNALVFGSVAQNFFIYL